MVDYQTLVGDAVDNVTGVDKVGPKTAVKLLLEYGSLDNLVANADKVKGAVGENLRRALDWLTKGRELLTIRTECDLKDHIPGIPALHDIVIGGQDVEGLQAFYERHGGKTIILARFVPIVRTFAPFVAGVGAMSYPRFILYNIAGAVLWVGLFVLGGYFFGNLEVVRRNFTFVILAIIAISVAPMAIEVLKSRARKPA